MINFKQLIQAVIEEENISGDVLGAPAAGTSQFSSDELYAQGDNRVPYMSPGVTTRRGRIKSKIKNKKRRRKKSN